MSKNNIIIPVVLGEKSFKSYLTFDVMKRQRLWKKPVTIAVCCYVLATICFAYQETYDWTGIVGGILVVITVLLPTNYFRSFHNSVNEQIKKMNLTSPRVVYTIHLSPISDGISFFYPEEKQTAGKYEWDCVVGAWRTHDAIYLYVTDTQALLIPDNDKNRDMNIIWNLIEKKLDPPRLHKAKNISR